MLVFFSGLLISPGFWRRKAVDKAIVTWIQSPTSENKQAIRLEQEKARQNQYVVCSLAVQHHRDYNLQWTTSA
jgi:hypothetical protein